MNRKEDLFASFMEMTKNLDDVQTVLFETAYGYHAKADLYEGFYFQYPHLSGTLYLWDEELQLFEEETDSESGNESGISNATLQAFKKFSASKQRTEDALAYQDGTKLTSNPSDKNSTSDESGEGSKNNDKNNDAELLDISREDINKLKKEQQKEEWEKLQAEEEAQRKAEIEKAINEAFVDFDDEAYRWDKCGR